MSRGTVYLVFLGTIVMINIPIVLLLWLLPEILFLTMILVMYLLFPTIYLISILGTFFNSARGKGKTYGKNQVIKFIKASENCLETNGKSIGHLYKYFRFLTYELLLALLFSFYLFRDPLLIVVLPFILILKQYIYFIIRWIGNVFVSITKSRQF